MQAHLYLIDMDRASEGCIGGGSSLNCRAMFGISCGGTSIVVCDEVVGWLSTFVLSYLLVDPGDVVGQRSSAVAESKGFPSWISC